MLRNLLNLKGANKVNSSLKSDLASTSDEEWEKMEKKLESDIDTILGEGIKKKKMTKKTENKENSDSDGSSVSDEDESKEECEWTQENLLGMMKEMELNFDRRKRQSRSNFWFNILVGAMFAITATFLVRLYIAGQWRSLEVCKGERPASFCDNCYGPFFGEWLWCVEDK